MTDALIERYQAAAVPFLPAMPASRRLRVGTTLVSCELAAAVLNRLHRPAEWPDTYQHINVHNPDCPLYFDPGLPGWRSRDGKGDHPVSGINWEGAGLIARGLGGRLPLVREWECFAANNQAGRLYPWGDMPPDDQHANFGEYFGGTTPVDKFPPTELGLYDLAGNLSEWCQDTHRAGGRELTFERVVKGGAWSKDASWLHIQASRGKWERLGTTTIGLRPVWDDPAPHASADHSPSDNNPNLAKDRR